MVPGPPSSMWLFSRGALTPLNQLCPWQDSPSLLAVSSHWLPRPSRSSESLADQEWGLPSHWGACPSPPGLLLPGYLGPQIRFWKRCYLRGRPEVQVSREDRLDGGKSWKGNGLEELGSSIPCINLGLPGIAVGGKTAYGLAHVESRALFQGERVFKTLEVTRI